MNKNVGIGLLVIIIAVAGYFVFRTTSKGPGSGIPEQALAQERILACRSCQAVLETTEGDVRGRKRSETGEMQCESCNEWELINATKCPQCEEYIALPKDATPPATECPKCGGRVPA